MNRYQREKNRRTAKALARTVKHIESMKHTCQECGEPGYHWVSIRGPSLEAMLTGVDDQQGFWTCAKFYGADGKRVAP